LTDAVTEIRPGVSSPASDPVFNFEDPTYNENKFYTTCSDNSNRVPVRAPVDGGLYAAVTRWLQINQFPEYRTMQDFIRDAVRHRLEYLNNKHPLAPRDDAMFKALDVYTRIAHQEQRVTRSRANEKFVNDLADSCQELLGREDWGELDGLLEDATDAFNFLPDAFRPRVQSIIDKFRPYLTGRTWNRA
jgi:hypothetical protein